MQVTGSETPAVRTSSRVDPVDLTIVEVETIALRVSLGRRFSGSGYSMDKRCTIVTRLHTKGGLVSETFNGDTDEEQHILVRIIHEELAPRLIGLSAADPEGCWAAMEPPTNNILRNRSLTLQSIACLDTAVWDLFGKALGQPIHHIWGACSEELPISVIGGYYHLNKGELGSLMQRYVEMGFAGCKLKVGGATPEDDADRVRIAREAAGSDFCLMVDANQGYTRAEAVEFGHRIRDFDIVWFEEPCRWTNDRYWMRDVRLQTGIPIAAGQSETSLAGLRDLMVDAAIDVSNFDASWAGGPTIWRKASGLAAAFGVQLGHHEEPQIAAHLLASVRDATFVECFDEERDPFFWQLLASRPNIRNGRYRLPTGAGFGIELDWDYVKRHQAHVQSTGG